MRDRTEITDKSWISGDAISAPETSCGLRCCRLTEETKRSTLVKVQTLTAFRLHQTIIFSVLEMPRGKAWVTVTRSHQKCICLLMNWFVFWTLKLMYDICWLLGVFRVRWAVLLSWPTRAVGPWECTAKWQMGTPPITTTTIFPRPPQYQAQLHQPKGSRHVDSGRSAPSRFAFLPQSYVRVTLVCYLVQFLYEGQFQRYTHKNIGYEKSKLGKLRSVSIYHCVCILSSRTTWCLC